MFRVASESIKQADKTPQAAVAQAGLNIKIDQFSQVDALLLRCFPGELIGIGIKQILFQLLADQIFGRQVVDELGILAESNNLHFAASYTSYNRGRCGRGRYIGRVASPCIYRLPARIIEIVSERPGQRLPASVQTCVIFSKLRNHSAPSCRLQPSEHVSKNRYILKTVSYSIV